MPQYHQNGWLVVLPQALTRHAEVNLSQPHATEARTCMHRIIARSDIFKPLFQDQYLDFMSKELVGVQLHALFLRMGVLPIVLKPLPTPVLYPLPGCHVQHTKHSLVLWCFFPYVVPFMIIP